MSITSQLRVIINNDASDKPLFSGEHNISILAIMESHLILDIFQLRYHHQESNILIIDYFRAEKKKKKIEMQKVNHNHKPEQYVTIDP